MPSSWRKVENEHGFIYYYNEVTKTRQWDHPKFSEIKQRLDDCNYIKYSTYRVASKFRVLQQALYMEEVPLSVIAGVFERHQLGATESTLGLETCDIEAVLSDVHFASNKRNHTNTDVDYAVELMLNFLYSIFDKERVSRIQVLATKLVLAVLSDCKLPELYHYVFGLCADHNSCTTRLKLQGLLSKFAQMTSFIHEDSTFGQHLVNSSVDDCFKSSPGLVGISESTFVVWMESCPQFLAWMPILHRLKLAETAVHAAKCSVCKTTPLLGLRYRCVKCSRYTQCQRCFFTARTSHSHKLSHSMREYCSEAGGKEFTHGLIKKLCSLVRCSLNYGSNNFSVDASEMKPISADKDWLLKSTTSSTSSFNDNEIKPLSTPQAQLQTIIRQLELQNRDLHQILLANSGAGNERQIKRYLEEHRVQVATQIRKLKILKDYLKISGPVTVDGGDFDRRSITESTPLVRNGRIRRADGGPDLEMLSPIYQNSERENASDAFPDERRDNFEEATYDANSGVVNANNGTSENSSVPYSIRDISTWIGGHPTTSYDDWELNSRRSLASDRYNKSPDNDSRPLQNDLDEALAKLQQILANNLTLDESLGNFDNCQLKNAVTEVEGMLTSLIDNVESSRANSAQSKTSESPVYRYKFV